MTQEDIIAILQQEYEAIDDNYEDLIAACNDDGGQEKQVNEAHHAALKNVMEAQKRAFDAGSTLIRQVGQASQAALDALNASLQNLQNIAATLHAIAGAVKMGASLVALGVPI